jgi:ubiquinone/menaquinone biosynthesis C-methylase UbiE
MKIIVYIDTSSYMNLLNNLSLPFLKKKATITPAEVAYDLWASFYDDQPHNLMLLLDEKIFSVLIKYIEFEDKRCLDFGCGTGRHWNSILKKQPQKIIGLDVSTGMLKKLKDKFPAQEVHKIEDNRLLFIPDSSTDIIISTLTIAHIKDINELFGTWSRIATEKADLVITDFHPAVLAKGGKRDFSINGQKIQIENFVHPLDKIQAIAHNNGFTLIQIMEKCINEEVKHFYSSENALNVYELFKGLPIIFGMHFKKL